MPRIPFHLKDCNLISSPKNNVDIQVLVRAEKYGILYECVWCLGDWRDLGPVLAQNRFNKDWLIGYWRYGRGPIQRGRLANFKKDRLTNSVRPKTQNWLKKPNFIAIFLSISEIS